MSASVISDRLSLVGLFMFSLFIWLSPPLAYAGLGFMLIAFLLNIQFSWMLLRKNPVFYIAVIAVIYIVVKAWLATREFPDTAVMQIVEAREWLLMWLFILVSWALKSDASRIHTALLLSLISLFLSVLTSIDWSSSGSFFDHRIAGLRIHVIQLGLFSATGILGLVIYIKQLIGDRSCRMVFYARALLWTAGLAFLIEILLLSETRAAWIAALLVSAVILIMMARNWFNTVTHKKALNFLVPLFGVSAVLAVLLFVNFDIVHNRVSKTQNVINVIVDTPVVKIPKSSVGERIRLADLGYDLWKERPLFGWGTGTSRYLIEQRLSNYSQARVISHPHLHDLYLEILVRFGLVGLIGFFLVLWVMLRNLAGALKSGQVSYMDFYFISGAMAMLLIWSLSDFLVLKMHGRFFWIFLAGLAFTFSMYKDQYQIRNDVTGEVITER